jgi:hypothetical protein
MTRLNSDDKLKYFAFGWEVSFYLFTKQFTDCPKDLSYTSREE